MTVRICYFLSWNRTTSEKDTYHLSSLHFDDGRWASNLSSKLCFCTTNAGSRRLGNKFKGTIFVNSLDGYIQCTHLGSVDTLFPFFPLNFYSQISTLTVVDKVKRRGNQMLLLKNRCEVKWATWTGDMNISNK